jgi:hypothetical protein
MQIQMLFAGKYGKEFVVVVIEFLPDREFSIQFFWIFFANYNNVIQKNILPLMFSPDIQDFRDGKCISHNCWQFIRCSDDLFHGILKYSCVYD